MIAQIIEEKTENTKDIIIELEDLADDITLKEIEAYLRGYIAKLNSINKNEAPKTKKEIRKQERLNRKLERIWNDRQSRKFWSSQMKLSECGSSFYRFYLSRDINFR